MKMSFVYLNSSFFRITISCLSLAIVFSLSFFIGRKTGKKHDNIAQNLATDQGPEFSNSNPPVLAERITKRKRVYFDEENTIDLELPQFEAILRGSRSYAADVFDLTNENFPADEEGKREWLKNSGIGKALVLLKVDDRDQIQILDETVSMCGDLIKLDEGIQPIARVPGKTVYDVFSLSIKGEQLLSKYGKRIDGLIGVEKSRTFQALTQTQDLQWGKLHYVYDKVEEISFVRRTQPDGTSRMWLYTKPFSGAEISKKKMQRWKHFEKPD